MRRVARVAVSAPAAPSAVVFAITRSFIPGLFGGNKDKNKDGGGGGFKMPGGFTPELSSMWQTMQNQAISASQISMMRNALSMRKTFSKFTPGGGDKDEGAKYIEKMMQLLEKKAKGEPAKQAELDAFTEELRQFDAKMKRSGGAAAASPQTTSSNPTSYVSSGSNAPPPPPSTPPPRAPFSNPNSPTIDELRKINLGPEIEALFTELRTMREKRNTVRTKLAEKEAELDRVATECKHAKDTEGSLRQRLQLAEQNVLLLNSELMDLKDKASELKSAKATVAKLQQAVHTLQTNDTAPLAKKVASLEHVLSEREDQLKSAARRMDRQRRRDPLLQFSGHVTMLMRGSTAAAAAGGSGPTSAASAPADASSPASSSSPASTALSAPLGGGVSASASDAMLAALEESFSALRDDFASELSNAWTTAAGRNGSAARHAVQAARDFFRRQLDYAAYDAVVTVSGNADAATALLASQGFVVAPLPGGKLSVAAPADGDVPAGWCGPYAYCAALSVLTAPNKQKASPAAAAFDFTVSAAVPAVSEALAQNTRRSRLEFDTSRSSKPGGQAANVSETQITVRLFIDNAFAFSSEAQDTRSAMSNKDLALQRLTAERLPQFNTELARGHFTRKFLERSDAVFAADGEATGSSLLALQQYVADAAAQQQQGVRPADVVLVQSLNVARTLLAASP